MYWVLAHVYVYVVFQYHVRKGSQIDLPNGGSLPGSQGIDVNAPVLIPTQSILSPHNDKKD